MTNVEALKVLYVALGGRAADIDDNATIAEAIVTLANAAKTATAAELPKVTASDNGKVLTVVSGKWAKADLPS